MQLSSYLLNAVADNGVSKVFGVAGDYNLRFLSHIASDERLEWIGTCNELNAAYAADGYARVNGLAVIAVTHGVGELSAINGIAGAYAEHVPVIMIGAMPSTDSITEKRMMHHTLQDGDLLHFVRAYGEVTVTQKVLSDPATAARDIDEAIAMCRASRRPVYLGVPVDMIERDIAVTAPGPVSIPAVDTGQRSAFAAAVRRVLGDARQAVVLVGPEVGRFGLAGRMERLAGLGVPICSTFAAKGVIDERLAAWVGFYDRSPSAASAAAQIVEHADALIVVGSPLADNEVGSPVSPAVEHARVLLRPGFIRVGEDTFDSIDFDTAVAELVEAAGATSFGAPTVTSGRRPAADASNATATVPGLIAQAQLWPAVAGGLADGDTVVVETGTSLAGMADQSLPADCRYLTQWLWGSIGFALPAALGAGLADPTRRLILVTGEGSLQLTAQELSSYARYGVDVAIVLVHNSGYTIERSLDGWNAEYNDIAEWDYEQVFTGLTAGRVQNVHAETPEQATKYLREHTTGITVVHVHTSKHDVPRLLRAVAEQTANSPERQ
ncbi:alpha-keto acid decarboxylase family protein [Nocardia sp. NPDC051570]|uniref:alpha-keto acid decarboxylase family protein n=1 Tax=Nocardia sp. NPDC051570 TaxID=3364324 RepID=UPI0037960D37